MVRIIIRLILLGAVMLVGLYFYNPKKLKERLHDASKSNHSYMTNIFYWAVMAIILISIYVLLAGSVTRLHEKLSNI